MNAPITATGADNGFYIIVFKSPAHISSSLVARSGIGFCINVVNILTDNWLQTPTS